MSDNLEVSVSKDNGYKTQWAKGLFYRKEGDKEVFKTTVAKWVVGVLSLFTCIVVLLKDSPNIEESKSSTIDHPDRASLRQPEIELNTYTETEKPKGLNKKRVIKFERLSVVSREEKVSIPLGTTAKAILKTGGTNGPVSAVLLEDVEFSGEIFIPEGATVYGMGNSTEERLLVSFRKFVTKDGIAKDITANAHDISDSILGLKGSVIGRTSKKIMAGAGLGVAGAFQTLQQSKNMGGVAVVKPSVGNALLSGASAAALGIAESELEELKNKQTVVEVPKDTEVLLVFGEVQ